MSVIKNVSKAVLVLSVLLGGAVFAAETPSLSALERTVSSELKAGKSAVEVARVQIVKKTDLGLIAAALVNAGLTPSQAVAAIIAAGGDPALATAAVIAAAGVASAKSVVATATALVPGQSAQIGGAAIAEGADVTSLPATGAGPAAGDQAAGQNSAQPTSAPALTAPSFGGGGGGAVSRS